jgi:hypothetical protein
MELLAKMFCKPLHVRSVFLKRLRSTILRCSCKHPCFQSPFQDKSFVCFILINMLYFKTRSVKVHLHKIVCLGDKIYRHGIVCVSELLWIEMFGLSFSESSGPYACLPIPFFVKGLPQKRIETGGCATIGNRTEAFFHLLRVLSGLIGGHKALCGLVRGRDAQISHGVIAGYSSLRYN